MSKKIKCLNNLNLNLGYLDIWIHDKQKSLSLWFFKLFKKRDTKFIAN